MSAENIQILIATCPNPGAAEAKLKAVLEARAEQGVEVADAAVVRRDEHNKLKIHETEDLTGGRGAAVGGLLGGVIGLLAGPGGVVMGATVGALVGGATARVFDTGIPHRRLEEIGNALTPGKAALVVLTEAGYVAFLETVVGEPGIEIVVESMNPQAAQELAHEHDVAVKALTMGDSLANGGMVSPTSENPS